MNLERTDAVNWSTLKTIGVSPKHYLHALAHPRADTDALMLGRVTHCAVLEPDELEGRFIVSPRFNRAMNDDTARAKGFDGGKQAHAAWRSALPADAEVVDPDIYFRALLMREALLADPIAALYARGGRTEHKIEWTDHATGIACRGRVDHVNGCLADLKTTRSLVTFERDAARYGYHAQLAWYSDGLDAAGITRDGPPCIIAIESVEPFDSIVLTFDEDDLAVGRRVYRKCLERLAECRRTGEWPGVAGGRARRIVLPAWAGPVEDEITLGGVPL